MWVHAVLFCELRLRKLTCGPGSTCWRWSCSLGCCRDWWSAETCIHPGRMLPNGLRRPLKRETAMSKLLEKPWGRGRKYGVQTIRERDLKVRGRGRYYRVKTIEHKERPQCLLYPVCVCVSQSPGRWTSPGRYTGAAPSPRCGRSSFRCTCPPSGGPWGGQPPWWTDPSSWASGCSLLRSPAEEEEEEEDVICVHESQLYIV